MCRIPAGLLHRITRQLILAIDYLRNECNIIHPGWSNISPLRNTSSLYIDAKPANILMAVPDDVLSSLVSVLRSYRPS